MRIFTYADWMSLTLSVVVLNVTMVGAAYAECRLWGLSLMLVAGWVSLTLSAVMLSVGYKDCHLCSVPFTLSVIILIVVYTEYRSHLCWVLLNAECHYAGCCSYWVALWLCVTCWVLLNADFIMLSAAMLALEAEFTQAYQHLFLLHLASTANIRLKSEKRFSLL
jgi:hypothetical protein